MLGLKARMFAYVRLLFQAQSSFPATAVVGSGALQPRRVLPIGLLVGLVGALLTFGAADAKADDFFGSSPGKLSMSHGSLDKADNCNDCHVNGSKALSNDK